MDKFDPEIHDDNPPLDAAFLAGMKPSRRGRPKLEAPKCNNLIDGITSL